MGAVGVEVEAAAAERISEEEAEHIFLLQPSSRRRALPLPCQYRVLRR